MRKVCCLIVLALLAANLTPCSADVSVSAASAIIMDADSGQVFYEKHADDRCLIASTTKIMTGYLACERCDLDAEFTVPPEAVGIEGSSIYLKAGEKLAVRALLYGAMLQSGNDAAMALAIATAGEEAAFVEQMNAMAQALGLKNTHYANPHGLDSEENYSTARDLANLTCAALRNPTFAEAVATKSASFGDRYFVNHNKLLWRYEGTVGVKTGYTKAAGRILVSAVRRDGRTLVAVTINAPDDWNDHARLYDSALSNYTQTALATAGEPVMTVPIAAGSERQIELVAKTDVSCLLLPSERVSYEYLDTTLLLPPFLLGHEAGSVRILIDGRQVDTVEVVWGATVLR